MMPQVNECANVGRDANHKRRFTFYLYLESRLDARTLKMYSIKDRSSRSLSILTLRRVIAVKRRPCVGPRASRVSLTRVLFSCYTLELSTAGLFWMQMTTSIGINQISKCNRICSMAWSAVEGARICRGYDWKFNTSTFFCMISSSFFSSSMNYVHSKYMHI